MKGPGVPLVLIFPLLLVLACTNDGDGFRFELCSFCSQDYWEGKRYIPFQVVDLGEIRALGVQAGTCPVGDVDPDDPCWAVCQVTWSISDPSIATVEPAVSGGNHPTTLVTGVAIGETVLGASGMCAGFGEHHATLDIFVGPNPCSPVVKRCVGE